MAIQIDGDSGVSGVNGSATTPALQGTDSNTGIVFGTDEVQIATGGSTRATVDSSGKLGVATTSPQSKLSVGNGASTDDGLSITFTGDNSTLAKYFANTSTGEVTIGGVATNYFPTFQSSGSEAMRLDTSGRLLVGVNTSSGFSSARMIVNSAGSSSTEAGNLVLQRGEANSAISNGDAIGNLSFADESGYTYAAISANSDKAPGSDSPGRLVFATTADGASASTERMRIDRDGFLMYGKTTTSISTAGCSIGCNDVGGASTGTIVSTVSGEASLYCNRISNDGILIEVRQANTQEGTINVSGTTVSYNGGHLSRWSQLAAGVERTEILRGSVLSNLDEMCEWAYEAQDAVLYTEEDELPEGVSVGDVKTPAIAAGTEDNEQLNRMKVSDVEGDVNVAGVFQGWDDDDDTYTNDFYCAMTGDFVIRIAQGTTVARGDLLMSAGDGTAKPQDDDIVRSKTIAKVTSTTVSTTYSDGSYCVPCVLMAC